VVGNSLPESEGARARRRDGTGRNEAEESAAAEISTRQSIAHPTEGDDGKRRKKNTDPLRNGTNQTDPPPPGVDFRLKFLDLQGKRLKLTVWDTAGQERFRTLTSSYYRGAHAVVFAYDVTRRETFDALEDVWMREVQLYSTVDAAARMVVGNKVDRAGGEGGGEREVSRAEGEAFARRHGCLFAETSAKLGQAVSDAFEELMLKVLDTPALLETGASGRMHLAGGGGGGAGGGGVIGLGGAARARISSSLSSCC
jgi:Ras-related protein Rab-18